MDPTAAFLCYLAAAACFLISALGGTKKGLSNAAALLPAGLLFWLLPTLWAAGARAL
ncbi:MAG TPA: hypothetical protein VFJ85_05160 [Acidimicrobiales bacterium]|nr:hypothetical protein [Acidimicrobiales bacterium]